MNPEWREQPPKKESSKAHTVIMFAYSHENIANLKLEYSV